MSSISHGAPQKRRIIPNPGLWLAIIAGIIITLLPLGDTLPVAGQNMIAILVFAIIVWISEAMDYTASAIVISALIIFMVGFAPDMNHPDTILGTAKALKMTLSGFSNSALALVAAAMFIAAAMTITGLDKRIALFTMSKIGASSRSIIIGAIVVTIVLSLVVPSATARTACVVPIMMGVIAAFKVDKHSRLAASMMIVIAQATSIWNVGIQTSAAQNLLSIGFINKTFGAGHSVSWLDWLLAGAPWSLTMSAILYFLARKLLPPETEAVEGGSEAIKKALAELGPTTGKEKRLIGISLLLLLFWSTGGKLHSIDTTSVTLAGLAIMLLPGIGVMSWKEVEKRVQWGTLLMFGIGISLGSTLLPKYLENIARGDVTANARPECLTSEGNLQRFHAHNGFGQHAGKVAVNAAIEQAKHRGFCLLTLCHAHHLGRMGHYGQMVADQGLAMLAMSNVTGRPALVAPWGGAEPRMTTNPFCFAWPFSDGRPPILVDFATSSMALNKARVMSSTGKQAAPGQLIDAQGNPSNDPGVLFSNPPGALLPFGEHKGFGLALMIEMMAGILSGGDTIAEDHQTDGSAHNHLFALIIDPDQFTDLAGEKGQFFADYLLATQPQPGGNPVIYPGMPEAANRERNAKMITIPVSFWSWVVEHYARKGIDLGLHPQESALAG